MVGLDGNEAAAGFLLSPSVILLCSCCCCFSSVVMCASKARFLHQTACLAFRRIGGDITYPIDLVATIADQIPSAFFQIDY